MKALILAAGSGRRMGKYSADRPKGMLEFGGKSLIAWQLEKFRAAGIRKIALATGYRADMLNFKNVEYFHNPSFESTNMVETLMCCRKFLDDTVIISYSDIVFTSKLLEKIMTFSGSIGVAVDSDWRRYWELRYGTTEFDLESLSVKEDGKLSGLGKPILSSEGLDYRYIGLNIFSPLGLSAALQLYDKKKERTSNWNQSGKPFLQGYMTDLLDELINVGTPVDAIISKGGWIEFDTEQDYETLLKAQRSGQLDKELF